ncbi:MAG: N-acetyl-1-D-myo-inositol-2-amino-2-deoxy-alpha-D-glucopyranoside deacetylase [Sciscionella sp.]
MPLTVPPKLLLVHAHPDDETIWTGGTIAHYAAIGVAVTVVTCTLGEEGEIIPAELRGLAADAGDQLGGYRVGELRSACAALGVGEHRFLGGIARWRDSGMAGTAANRHPRAFAAGLLEEQTDALEEIVEESAPQVIVSYDAFGGYGHPDHIRAHEITEAVAERQPGVLRAFHTVNSATALEAGLAELSTVESLPFRMPTAAERHVREDSEIDTVLDISGALSAKLSALRAHATQVSLFSDGARSRGYALSNGIAAPVLAREYYTLAAGPAQGCADDLFGGLLPVRKTGAPHENGGGA